eukprot:Stramenopile-MAST_4_protein_6326
MRKWTLEQAKRVIADVVAEQKLLLNRSCDATRENVISEDEVVKMKDLELSPKKPEEVDVPFVSMDNGGFQGIAKEKILRWSRLRLAAARLMREDGLQSEALPVIREALKGFEWSLGKNDLETLSCAIHVGNILRDLTYQTNDKSTKTTILDEAMSLYERVREGRAAQLGEDSPATLWALNNISLCLDIRGDKQEAENLCRRTYEGRLRILGEQHGDTLTSLNNLAFFKSNRSEYKGAVEMFRKAVRISTDVK